MRLLKLKKIISIEKDRNGQLHILTDGQMDAAMVADHLLGALIFVSKRLVEKAEVTPDLLIQLVTSELEKKLKE